MPSFFLSRASTHDSFTFDLQFLHEMRHKVFLSKIVCEIFHFRFRFVLYESLYFSSTKWMESLTLKTITSFKIKIIERRSERHQKEAGIFYF